jgi:ureidoglycolate hydrolase
MMKLVINELNPAAFAPFGQVIRRPIAAADGEGPGWRWWGGLPVAPGDSAYAVGYLDLQPVEQVRFDWAERHADSYELLAPTADVVIHVAPPDNPDDLGYLPPLERFQLFRVRRGEAVLLHPKVWHGAPLALAEPANVVVLLRQDTGPENSRVVQFGGEVIEGMKQ